MKRVANDRWRESAVAALGRSGHRAGGARMAVIELLAGQSCCLSAQQVRERLDDGGRHIGLASVYRALELLYRLELVQRVDLGDGEQRWEPILPGGEHHHHAVCDTCGRVTAFEDSSLESALERLSGRLHHSISAHEIVIHGNCDRCVEA